MFDLRCASLIVYHIPCKQDIQQPFTAFLRSHITQPQSWIFTHRSDQRSIPVLWQIDLPQTCAFKCLCVKFTASIKCGLPLVLQMLDFNPYQPQLPVSTARDDGRYSLILLGESQVSLVYLLSVCLKFYFCRCTHRKCNV